MISFNTAINYSWNVGDTLLSKGEIYMIIMTCDVYYCLCNLGTGDCTSMYESLDALVENLIVEGDIKVDLDCKVKTVEG